MATALSTLSVSNRDLNAFSVLSPPLSERSSRSPITTRGLQISGPVRVAVGKPGAPRQRRRKWQRREQAGQCGLGPARGKPGPAMISGTRATFVIFSTWRCSRCIYLYYTGSSGDGVTRSFSRYGNNSLLW